MFWFFLDGLPFLNNAYRRIVDLSFQSLLDGKFKTFKSLENMLEITNVNCSLRTLSQFKLNINNSNNNLSLQMCGRHKTARVMFQILGRFSKK